MDFKTSVTVRPSRKSTIKIYDTSHHIFKACGYTTLQKDSSQKMRRRKSRNTVTAY